MPEFPAIAYREPVGIVGVCSAGSCSYGGYMLTVAATFGAASTWPLANRAIFMPVMVEDWVTVYQMSIQVGTQSGNIDIGIYDEAGNRIVSSGSTVMGASGLQLINITDTVLAPGGYYLALSVDNTTASLFRNTAVAPIQECHGIKNQDLASVTLPATATLVAPGAYAPQVTAHLNSVI